jgi:signal transduction histidine kinase
VRLPVLPALAVLALLLVLAAGVAGHDPVRTAALVQGLHLLSATLLTGAGVLCLVRWRMTGLTRPAFVGIALLVVGMFAPFLRSLGPLVYGAGMRPLAGQLPALGTGLAVLWLLGWARRAPAIDAQARPARVLAAVALAVPLGCLAVLAWSAPLSAGADALPAAVLGLLPAALWGAVLTREWRAGLDGRSPWLVLVVGCLAAAAALGGVVIWAPQPAGAWAAVLLLAAGVVALHGAFRDVLISLSAQSSRLLGLIVDVHDHKQEQRSAQAQDEERLHEVRNVLAGLHGAAAALRRYEDRLDPGVRHRLQDAATAELQRLAHLVDPAQVVPVVDLDLAVVLAPVVVAEQEQGAELQLDLRGAWVRGRSTDVATVLSALLVNARRHAPGSPVLLRAELGDGESRVYVEDVGPGVPLDKRQAVFERGERAGATVAGSGLGLYTARRLAMEMGGTLQVDSRPGGGASFVLTLAAGSARLPRQGTGEGGSQRGEVTDLQVLGGLDRPLIPSQHDDGAGLYLAHPPGGHDGHVDGTVGDGVDAIQV